MLIPRWLAHVTPGLLFIFFTAFGFTGCFDGLFGNASATGIYYFHPNHVGSVKMVTDESGSLVHNYRYDPYGSVFTDSGTGESKSKYKFTAQEEDSTTGLYYYNARFYDPAIGRFITPDSVVPHPANTPSFNRYLYANGNPMRFNDPTGNETAATGGDAAACLAWAADASAAYAGSSASLAAALAGGIIGGDNGAASQTPLINVEAQAPQAWNEGWGTFMNNGPGDANMLATLPLPEPYYQIPDDPNDYHCDINSYNQARDHDVHDPGKWNGNDLTIDQIARLYSEALTLSPKPNTQGYGFADWGCDGSFNHMFFYSYTEGDTVNVWNSDGINPQQFFQLNLGDFLINHSQFAPLK